MPFRNLSRYFMSTPTATDPANLQSRLCIRLASAARSSVPNGNFWFQLSVHGRAPAESGLGGGEACDRHAKRRTRYVVEPDLVAERDRGRVAAVFAANAEPEIFPHLPAARGGDAEEFADALAVDRHERVGRQNALRRIDP